MSSCRIWPAPAQRCASHKRVATPFAAAAAQLAVSLLSIGSARAQNWSLAGNAGTVAGPNFLGTTDLSPLGRALDPHCERLFSAGQGLPKKSTTPPRPLPSAVLSVALVRSQTETGIPSPPLSLPILRVALSPECRATPAFT